jgi:hypothetical protein
MEIKPYSIFSAVCLSCALITGGFGVARNQAATNANSARTEALRQITNYRLADSCWELEANAPLTIGTVVKLPTKGKSPTQCFKDPFNETYAYVGYLNGRLQVLYVFTQTEVKKE